MKWKQVRYNVCHRELSKKSSTKWIKTRGVCVSLSKIFIRTDNVLQKNMCYGQSRQPEIASRHWKYLFFRRLQNHYFSSREEPFSWCYFHFKVSVFWASAVFCLVSQTVWSILPRLTEGCSVRIYLYLAVQVRPRQHDFLHRPTCCMQVVCRLSLRECLGFSCSFVDLL